MDNVVKYGDCNKSAKRVIPMSQLKQEVVNNLGAKLGTIWTAIGLSSWSEAAGFLAFILSFLALAEWVWKKALRPILVHYGKLKPQKRLIKMVEVDDE